MRQEVLLPYETNSYTPNEEWTTRRDSNHWYAYQADYALENLGRGPGSLLIIGSPIFEAVEFENEGWDVTYMDVREPPLVKNYLKGDASTFDFPKDTYDAVSSTCVICHAGMGRYGDESVEDGDIKILQNIHKTLKKGGRAALTFGPVSAEPVQYRLGNMQRVFSVDPSKSMVLNLGFRILDLKIRDLQTSKWVDHFEEPQRIDRHYLSMFLMKD